MEAKIIEWIIYALFATVIWWNQNNIGETNKRLDKLEEKEDNYVRRTEFLEFKTELKEMFRDIKTDIKEIKNQNEKDHLAR